MYTSATHVAGRFGIVQLERYNPVRVAIFQTDLQRGVAEVDTIAWSIIDRLCVLHEFSIITTADTSEILGRRNPWQMIV